MTTVRFNPPEAFKREFLEDGNIKATCEYCGAVILGLLSARSASESAHRLSCISQSQPAADGRKADNE